MQREPKGYHLQWQDQVVHQDLKVTKDLQVVEDIPASRENQVCWVYIMDKGLNVCVDEDRHFCKICASYSR